MNALNQEITSRESGRPSIRHEWMSVAGRYAMQYSSSTVVLKFSGKILNNPEELDEILRLAINLKQFGTNVLIMHGGGPQINDTLDTMGIPRLEKDGRRLCDESTRDVSLKALRENNLTIWNRLNALLRDMRNRPGFDPDNEIFGQAEGGFNAGMIRAEIFAKDHVHGYNFTGYKAKASSRQFKAFADQNVIPILYSICLGPDGELLNVNADEATEAVAKAAGADKVFFIGEEPGVLDENKTLIPLIFADQVAFLTGNDTRMTDQEKEAAIVTGGMIPKVEAALSVAENGISAVILSPKAIFDEVFTDGGGGTEIRQRKPGETNAIDAKMAPMVEREAARSSKIEIANKQNSLLAYAVSAFKKAIRLTASAPVAQKQDPVPSQGQNIAPH